MQQASIYNKKRSRLTDAKYKLVAISRGGGEIWGGRNEK